MPEPQAITMIPALRSGLSKNTSLSEGVRKALAVLPDPESQSHLPA